MMAHGREKKRNLLFVVADIRRLLLHFDHQDTIGFRIARAQSGQVQRELVSKDQNEIGDDWLQVEFTSQRASPGLACGHGETVAKLYDLAAARDRAMSRLDPRSFERIYCHVR